MFMDYQLNNKLIHLVQVPFVVFLFLILHRPALADRCQLPLARGSNTCRGRSDRWFYNGTSCRKFQYSGCDGNENNFESKDKCWQECPGHISEDENLIRRIRNFTTVTSSQPHWKDWAAERAIDFNDSTEAETCNCCSALTHPPTWWRIDLGARYPIEKIIFVGRSDGGATYHSRKFSMYKYDDFRGMHPKHELIYKNNATHGHKFMILFRQQLILQFVEITSTTVLVICEIKFKESERCPPGYFGKHCMKHCNCQDGLPCERLTGVCENPGCLPGWQGDSCDRSCDWGSYGDGCARNCHCLRYASCESVSGNCSNGACTPGWKGLPTCSEECDWGKFGDGCAQHCHCYQNASCNNVNGTCLTGLCAAGWKTHSCSEACQPGTFGLKCRSMCHCANERGCNHFNGSCADNVCEPGWQGNNCSIDTEPEQQAKASSSITAIVGPILAVIVFMMIVIVGCILRRQMRARKSNGTIRYKHGQESAQQDRLVEDHIYKNETFDEHALADENVYHDINDVGPTRGFAVKQLWYHVQSLYQNDSQKLTQEFQSFQTNVLELNAKAKRNRGNNDTQIANAEPIKVALTDEKTVQHYQYDAIYIDGYDKSQKYIVAKGPSSKTEINTFWEMIYQANVHLILMLQESKPQNKKEMMQYWAAEGDAVYGSITVKTVKFSTDTDLIIRKFEVIKANQQRRHVMQIQYNGFVANILPCNLTSFINFWRKSIRMSDSRPLLVHGSDYGSAGLYMALDILYAQANVERCVNPGEIARQICSQQGNLIQTKEQYGMLYEALAEALHIRVLPISAKEFPSFVSALRAEDPLQRQSGMVLQYETLFGSDPEYFDLQPTQQEHEYSSLSLSSNKRSHGEAPALPDRTAAQTLLIDLQNFANQNAFILTSVDDGITNCQLWKTIDTRKVKTIISLDTMNLSVEKSSPELLPDTDKYSVSSVESIQENGCVINTYAYKRKNKIEAETKIVKSFHFLEWGSDDPVPKSVKSVITFSNAIKKCQPEITEQHPVLLINRSNMKNLGTFYILLNELERIRQTEEVSIIETTLRLKDGHSNLTPSFEAYQFCHTVIVDLIADNVEYANV